jgi:hypothetical protein
VNIKRKSESNKTFNSCNESSSAAHRNTSDQLGSGQLKHQNDRGGLAKAREARTKKTKQKKQSAQHAAGNDHLTSFLFTLLVTAGISWPS